MSPPSAPSAAKPGQGSSAPAPSLLAALPSELRGLEPRAEQWSGTVLQQKPGSSAPSRRGFSGVSAERRCPGLAVLRPLLPSVELQVSQREALPLGHLLLLSPLGWELLPSHWGGKDGSFVAALEERDFGSGPLTPGGFLRGGRRGKAPSRALGVGTGSTPGTASGDRAVAVGQTAASSWERRVRA